MNRKTKIGRAEQVAKSGNTAYHADVMRRFSPSSGCHVD